MNFKKLSTVVDSFMKVNDSKEEVIQHIKNLPDDGYVPFYKQVKPIFMRNGFSSEIPITYDAEISAWINGKKFKGRASIKTPEDAKAAVMKKAEKLVSDLADNGFVVENVQVLSFLGDRAEEYLSESFETYLDYEIFSITGDVVKVPEM